MNWQTIDTAPKDGSPILVYTPTDGVVVSWWFIGAYVGRDGIVDGWYSGTHDDSPRAYHDYPMLPSEIPTHWMPLPEPPSAPEQPA
jgi:hypothetical protein